MIKLLSIGNSFSEDAHRYLHKVAKNEGVALKCVNLYIGGCSLYSHYINMLEDRASYVLEYNGDFTGFYVSIRQALTSDKWDYITLQQVSHEAPDYNSYQPYLAKLYEYVRLYAPKAKILIHQTWAYEQGCDRLTKELGFADHHEMLNLVKEANEKAAEEIGADGIIPCGEAIMSAAENGIEKIHRDTFHAGLGVGRYLLALIWYRVLTGNKAQNSFNDFDVPVSEEEKAIAHKVVDRLFEI